MELDTSDGYDDFDGSGIIAMTIIPLSSEERTAGEGQNAEEREDRDGDEEVKEIFKSLSACADLHPDPVSGSEDGMEIEGDGGGEPYISMRESGIDGLPPPIPGSGGWITAENVGNFFDEEGNFRGRALGQGAGNVRERDGEGDVDDGGDGEGLGPDEEVKRRRVE
jgi:nucleotide-sensitive chloride channel 1A